VKRSSSKDTIRGFLEVEYPTAVADLITQAMELRVLVIVADVRDDRPSP
jgi:hypothetical protein